MKKSINNQQSAISNRFSGFSLIEILVATSLVAILMAGANQVLFSFLKSEQKARSTIEVKEVGDNALAVMANEIRNAEEITLPCGNSIVFIPKEDLETTVTFSCVEGEGGGIMWNGGNLTGPNLVVTNCSFSCASGKYGSVGISFTLEKTSDDPVRKANPVSFNTQVMLRNW